MSLLRELASRVRGAFRPRRSDRDLQDELEHHLAMAADEARRRHEETSDAARMAVVRAGGVSPAMDALRDQRGLPWLSGLVRDVRYACRSLIRARALTVVAVTSLALGIGANAVIFSVVDAALLRPLPYRDADRLVELLQTVETLGGDRMQTKVRGQRIADLRAMTHVFDGAAAYSDPRNLALADGPEMSLSVGGFAPGLPGFLGIAPRLGRDFGLDDIAAGDSVVISDAYWRRAFGRDPQAIGATIPFANGARVIVGVMPPSFRYFVGARTDAWLPIAERDGEQVVARLRPGLAAEDAQREVDAAIASPAAAWKPLGLEVQPAAWNRGGEYFVRRAVATRPMLFGLLGAVGLLLLIACANVANLLLSRTITRQREIAVRRSLGASRRRVAQLLLAEGFVLAGLGSAAAAMLAWWGIRALPALVPADLTYTVFGVTTPALDTRVLVFGCLVAVLTGLLCGGASAIRAFTSDVSDTRLMGGGQRIAGPSRAQRGVHAILHATQVALTVVLLAGAGLLVASVYRMVTVPPGFDAQRLGYAMLEGPPTWRGRSGNAIRRAFLGDLEARLGTVPGIDGVTMGQPPVAGFMNRGFLPEGAADVATDVRTDNYYVYPDYFDVSGIAVVNGRTFSEADGAGGAPVAVINESAARRFWPDGSAVGRQFRRSAGDEDELPTTIVGVVADVRTINLASDHVNIYWPAAQASEPSYVLFRASGDLAPVVAAIRTAARDLDSSVAVARAGTVDSLYAELAPVGPVRFYAAFLGLFAATALLTAAVGLYGALSYSVSRRTHEIGVRLALGATRARVRALVVREALAPVVAGLAVGIVAAVWLTRFIASQLFQVTPRDPVVFGLIVVLLLGVSVLAAVVPLRRAVRIDPAVALRAD